MVRLHGAMVQPLTAVAARLTALRLRSRAALVPRASRQGARAPETSAGGRTSPATGGTEGRVCCGKMAHVYGNLWMIYLYHLYLPMKKM